MNDPREEFASLFAKMEENFLRGRFIDVHVKCNSKIFPCHRLILTAASEYFDGMLGSMAVDASSRIIQISLPPSIRTDTFRLVLRYMYSGKVSFLSDHNIYHLFVASRMLGVASIEKACRHYLSQNGVPNECAMRLFRYACSHDDASLQSTTSRYLLKNKGDIIASNMKTSEFRVILSYFRASSRIEEEEMVDTIFKWTLPLCLNAEGRERARINFTNSVNAYVFEYLPYNYAAEYFEKMMAIDSLLRLDEGASRSASHASRSSDDSLEDLALHLFSNNQQNPLELSTLRKKDGAWSSWSVDSSTNGVGIVQKLRCQMVGDRLYWLASRGLDQSSLTFHYSTSVNLAAYPHKLPSPFSTIHPPASSSLHLCSDRRSTIVACAGNFNMLSSYNCELVQWSNMNLGEFFPRAMTWYDRQLYLFGGVSPTSSENVLHAIDLRDGRLREVFRCELFCGAHSIECCMHKERLYLASARDCPSKMVIFDPIAGKLMNMLVRSHPIPDVECRLASFQDTLWTFYSDANSYMLVDTFNTCTQTFENAGFDAMMSRGSHLLDVLVCKPESLVCKPESKVCDDGDEASD